MLIKIAALTAIALFGVASPSFAACSPQSSGERTSKDAREIGWMQRGKAAVKEKLRDPSSAQYKEVYFCRGSRDIPMTCGSVNSKNGFGGYSGYQRFISGGSANVTFLESEVNGFGSVWAQMCR